MNKIRSIIIGLAVVIFAVSAVYAQPQQGEYQQCADKEGGRHVLKELNLTPEQQQKLEVNRKAQREELGKLRAAVKEKQTQLQEALKNPAVTRASIEPLVSDIKSLHAQLTELRISGIFAVKEILTPEQFAKFQQLMEKRQENRKGRLQERREKRKEAKQD